MFLFSFLGTVECGTIIVWSPTYFLVNLYIPGRSQKYLNMQSFATLISFSMCSMGPSLTLITYMLKVNTFTVF